MKIEKGKLYLDTESKTLFKADFDSEIYGNFVSDKVAVHCPNKDDWEHVINFVGNGLEYDYTDYEDESVVYIDRGRYASVQWAKNQDYHIITIDQFKEFYPPISKEEQKESYDDPYSWVNNALEAREDEEILRKAKDRAIEQDKINPKHYTQYKIQPIDYIDANRFDFFEGNVIKYVSRYKEKNGLEDLKKAQVYLQRLIDRYEN